METIAHAETEISNFRDLLLEHAVREPAGIPTLAKRAGCSMLTAKKWIGRLTAENILIGVRGSRGMVYGPGEGFVMPPKGETPTRKASAPKTAAVVEPWAKKGMEVTMANGGKTAAAVLKVTAVKKDRTGIKINYNGNEITAKWDPAQGCYLTSRGKTIRQA